MKHDDINYEDLKPISIKGASKRFGIPAHKLRAGIRFGVYPFATVRGHACEVFSERYIAWLRVKD